MDSRLVVPGLEEEVDVGSDGDSGVDEREDDGDDDVVVTDGGVGGKLDEKVRELE